MGSPELRKRMYLEADYFKLGPSLVKRHSQDDEDGGGYVIRFLSDQQGCWTLSLYLSPEGHHCVLYNEIDVYCPGCSDEDEYGRSRSALLEGYPKYEPFERIARACSELDLQFACADFDECLFVKHFDGWYAVILGAGRELTEIQKEYIANWKEL